LHNAAQLWRAKQLSITVISYSRMDTRHKRRAIPTKEMIGRIPSAKSHIEVTLGALGLYGSGNGIKLSFALHSVEVEELEDEIRNYEQAYEDANWPLKADFNNPSGEATPHLSVA